MMMAQQQYQGDDDDDQLNEIGFSIPADFDSDHLRLEYIRMRQDLFKKMGRYVLDIRGSLVSGDGAREMVIVAVCSRALLFSY